MPPKGRAGRGAGAPPPPVRAAACCDLVISQVPQHMYEAVVEVRDGRHSCRRCSWLVHEHPLVPPPAQAVVQPAPVVAGAAAAVADVPNAGPQASLALLQESPLAFLGVMAAWKNAMWCQDDSDKVQRRMEEVQAAWIRGAYRIVGRHLRVVGASESITRTFAYKPIPDGTPDEVVFRQERGLAILACVKIAEAILDIAQSYARKRCIIDKVVNPVAVSEDLRTDEWFAIVEARKSSPKAGPGELEPEPDEFSTPDKLLWWFFFLASVSTTNMQARLERAVREYGALYRSKNPTSFCAKAVWDVTYSPEVVAAKKAKTRDRAALASGLANLATGPQKRQRDPSVAASATGTTPPGAGKGKTPAQVARQHKKMMKWKEKRAGKTGGAAAAGAAGADEEDEEDDFQSGSLTPAHAPSLARTGTSSSNTSPGIYSSSRSSGGSTTVNLAAGGGGGRGRGRGRGGRGRF